MKFNPVFNTSVLYWACMFNQIDLKTVEDILNKLEAYPEAPVNIDNWRTPCHAATFVGNHAKLKVLLTDVNARYKKQVRPGEVRNYDKKNIC